MFQGGESFGESNPCSILIGMQQERIHYIYLITNTINSKVYVGQTVNVKNRKGRHWFEGKKPDSKNHLYRSMYEHGVENFRFETIEECSMDNVDERERYWISHYRSCDPAVGYNKEFGGNLGKASYFAVSGAVKTCFLYSLGTNGTTYTYTSCSTNQATTVAVGTTAVTVSAYEGTISPMTGVSRLDVIA